MSEGRKYLYIILWTLVYIVSSSVMLLIVSPVTFLITLVSVSIVTWLCINGLFKDRVNYIVNDYDRHYGSKHE